MIPPHSLFYQNRFVNAFYPKYPSAMSSFSRQRFRLFLYRGRVLFSCSSFLTFLHQHCKSATTITIKYHWQQPPQAGNGQRSAIDLFSFAFLFVLFFISYLSSPSRETITNTSPSIRHQRYHRPCHHLPPIIHHTSFLAHHSPISRTCLLSFSFLLLASHNWIC